MKENITVRLDYQKYKRFKEIVGKRPSEFIQQVIDAVIEAPVSEKDRLYQLRLQLKALQIARDLLLSRLRILEQQIYELEEHIKEAEEVARKSDRDELFRQCIVELNSIIRKCNYEFLCSWQKSAGVRKRLSELGFEVTREWLMKHIERLLIWS